MITKTQWKNLLRELFTLVPSHCDIYFNENKVTYIDYPKGTVTTKRHDNDTCVIIYKHPDSFFGNKTLEYVTTKIRIKTKPEEIIDTTYREWNANLFKR